jgi:thiamine-phosphate pyrophosphorylase
VKLPRLYPILDVELLCRQAVSAEQRTETVLLFAEALATGGASLFQYRNKQGSAAEMLFHVREIRRKLPQVRLIINDRADVAVAAGCDGVHLGQDDLSTAGARLVCKPPMLIGRSTHNEEQAREADGTDADYIAIGPVFATSSKTRPDPVVGLAGVKAARRLTQKPLVAIGGITRLNCKEVLDAGADSVAVISDLLDSPAKSVEEFLQLLM